MLGAPPQPPVVMTKVVLRYCQLSPGSIITPSQEPLGQIEVPNSSDHRAGAEELWGWAGVGPWRMPCGVGAGAGEGGTATSRSTLQGLMLEEDKDLDFHVKYNCLLLASN